MEDFRKLLQQVNRSYDDFVSGVISYVKIPGNEDKIGLISDFIYEHPTANSSDVLEFMIYHTDFFESIHGLSLEMAI